MLYVRCTHCGRRVRAGDDWAGRTGNCPKCQHEITFPGVLADEWEHQPAHYKRPPRLSLRIAPVVDSFVQDLCCILAGGAGGFLAYKLISEFPTDKSTGFLFTGFHRFSQPLGFWFATGCNVVLAFILLWIGVAGVFKLAEDTYALVPKRFKLRTFLIAMVMAGVVLWPATQLALALFHDRVGVLAIVGLATLALCILGNTWVEHINGCFESRHYEIPRYGQPFRFFVAAFIRYSLGIALLLAAVVIYLFFLGK
jgi:hypothetical protein